MPKISIEFSNEDKEKDPSSTVRESEVSMKKKRKKKFKKIDDSLAKRFNKMKKKDPLSTVRESEY